MRNLFALFVLLIPAISAQTRAETRTFAFSSDRNAQEMNETATVIHVITDGTSVAPDMTKRTVTVKGPADQVAIGTWLFETLEGPAPTVPAAQQDFNSPVKEYRLSGDEAIRVFYMPAVNSEREFQEILTLARSTSELRRLFSDNRVKAAILRGPREQIDLSQWLLTELASASRQQPASTLSMHEYPLPVRADWTPALVDSVRIYYLPGIATLQDFQELLTTVRFVADIRQLFGYSTARAAAARGSKEQLAMVDWLFREFDRAASESASPKTAQTDAIHQYQDPQSGDIVRVFYLSQAGTPEQMSQIAKRIRTATNVHRIGMYLALGAIAVRGTAQQIDTAGRIVTAGDE